MDMLFTVITIAVVVVVLGFVAFVLVGEPFVDHRERYRDSQGRKLGSSPHL